MVGGKSLIIPPRTMVLPSLIAMHTMPQYWGNDSLIWGPSRWILPSSYIKKGSPARLKARLDEETMLVPPEGTNFPWSDGQRNCPGKKFAQVEFVAVMANLFRAHRVEPVARHGESQSQVQRRLLNKVNDSKVRMLLQIRDPNGVPLLWTRRTAYVEKLRMDDQASSS